MIKLNYIGWIILVLFAILFGYIGTRALHFNYPILFIVITIIGSMMVILLFSFLRNKRYFG